MSRERQKSRRQAARLARRLGVRFDRHEPEKSIRARVDETLRQRVLDECHAIYLAGAA